MKLLEDLYTAYYDARRNKRNTANQLKFELRLEDNLLRLYNQLLNRTYKVGRCVAFIIEQPVKREVFAANFADRVVHHLYFNYVNEIFERSFIDDSYSCRKGKGTAYGIKRLDHHIRSCSQNYTQECYVLKLDLSGYFMSINRQKLYNETMAVLEKYADRKNSQGCKYSQLLDYDLLQYLSREIIFHDPVAGCFIRGDAGDWDGLPADKSLFRSKPECGLPIGNLTSQLYSNVYLNQLDHYMKREMKAAHYGRYVDDFFVVSKSKKYLCTLITKVATYLKENLGVVLHPRKIYLQNIHRGVSFLGTVVKPFRIYIHKRTMANFKKSLARERVKGNVFSLTQGLNSYLGILMHYKTFGLRKTVVMKNSWALNYGWMTSRYTKFRPDNLIPAYE